jgi:hypothetical protein
LPLYRPPPQLLAHSGQSKATTVRSFIVSNKFNCNVGPSTTLVLEDVAESAFWGWIGCCFLSLCSESAQGPLLPCDARLPIMYIYFPK